MCRRWPHSTMCRRRCTPIGIRRLFRVARPRGARVVHVLIAAVTILGILMACLPTVWASDRDKEARWASQIVDSLIDGEAVMLSEGESEFLAIYTVPERSRGSVIVLHGLGVHPNWPQVVYPLRVGLAERGWTTLALQLPILPNEATADAYQALMPEVVPRLASGTAFLAREGSGGAIIVAHSMGALMTTYALANGLESVEAFAGIGMSGRNREHLAQIKIPVLDLFGSDDLEDVLDSAEARRAAAAHNDQYTQRMVQGADHFFNDADDVLVETVAQWLEALRE